MLITLLNTAARISLTPLLAEIIEALLMVLNNDVNINVSSCTAKALSSLALRLRTDFSLSVVKVMEISFDRLKEKKALLRNELIELTDTAATTLSLTDYAYAVVNGLQSKNPQSRAQTAYFIARLLSKHSTVTIPLEGVKRISPGLVKCSFDADAEVRDASFRALGAIWRCLGDAASRQLLSEIIDDKIKMDKIMEYYEKSNEQFGINASVEMQRLHALELQTKKNSITKMLEKNCVSSHSSYAAKTASRRSNRVVPGTHVSTLKQPMFSSTQPQLSTIKSRNGSLDSSSQIFSTRNIERTRPVSARTHNAPKPNIIRPTTSVMDTSQNVPHSSRRKIIGPNTVRRVSNVVSACKEISTPVSSNLHSTSRTSKLLVNNFSVKATHPSNECSASSRPATGIRLPSAVSRLTTGIPRLTRPSTPSKN